MAALIFQAEGVNVTRYAGPVPTPTPSATRVRYQITNTLTGRYVQLSSEQFDALAQWFAEGYRPYTNLH